MPIIAELIEREKVKFKPKRYRAWESQSSTTDSTTNTKDSTTDSTTNTKDSTTDSTTNTKDSTTDSTTNTKDSTTFYLSLLSKKLVIYFLDNLENKKKLITKKICVSSLSSLLEEKVKTVRQSLLRLKNKKYIKTIDYSTSSISGYSQYEIDKDFFTKFKKTYIYNSNNINTNTTIKKKEAEILKKDEDSNQGNGKKNYLTFQESNPKEIYNSLETQNSNILSQSESTQKTNDKIKYEELPEEWKNINYHFLDDLHFKQHHIVGLYKLDVLEPEVVQESIEHFAYGIKHNPDNYTKYTDPLKVFYGSLRKGKPWTESTYKSTKEMATEDLIQRRKVEKRKIANETCKLVEEMEKESYEKWYYSLSEEEKKEIKEKHKLQESGIFNIFDEKIYKLHYGKYVMEEYKDPSEVALEEFIAKKKRKEEAEAKRIKKMLQEGGMIKEYYKWAGELKEKEIQEITEEEGGMTERGQNKMIIYYGKNLMN